MLRSRLLFYFSHFVLLHLKISQSDKYLHNSKYLFFVSDFFHINKVIKNTILFDLLYEHMSGIMSTRKNYALECRSLDCSNSRHPYYCRAKKVTILYSCIYHFTMQSY
ncbi:hypothetical protein BDQ17DRAFT_1381598 [Cyathus striatus]|nr:hypothetical protein BDQ17DRAFT_1381598 [Cyathus striatus]